VCLDAEKAENGTFLKGHIYWLGGLELYLAKNMKV
jgi:hypothetical protein